jgi:hypothetical protein
MNGPQHVISRRALLAAGLSAGGLIEVQVAQPALIIHPKRESHIRGHGQRRGTIVRAPSTSGPESSTPDDPTSHGGSPAYSSASRGWQTERLRVGMAARRSASALATPRAAKPSAVEARRMQAVDDIWTGSHQLPHELAAMILDHQHHGSLVDRVVAL